MKAFGGKVLVLDRSDINTDEIIPAKYLTEITKEALKPFCLEDLKLPGFDGKREVPGKGVVVTRANFGCGSSREHAPWALEVNGINVVIAESFARIFRQNMYNGGLLAIELPKAEIDLLIERGKAADAEIHVDIEKSVIRVTGGGKKDELPFKLGGFEKALVVADGWVGYAASKY